jgi:hypothetical protein
MAAFYLVSSLWTGCGRTWRGPRATAGVASQADCAGYFDMYGHGRRPVADMSVLIPRYATRSGETRRASQVIDPVGDHPPNSTPGNGARDEGSQSPDWPSGRPGCPVPGGGIRARGRPRPAGPRRDRGPRVAMFTGVAIPGERADPRFPDTWYLIPLQNASVQLLGHIS